MICLTAIVPQASVTQFLFHFLIFLKKVNITPGQAHSG